MSVAKLAAGWRLGLIAPLGGAWSLLSACGAGAPSPPLPPSRAAEVQAEVEPAPSTPPLPREAALERYRVDLERYRVDLERAREVWPEGPAIARSEDLFGLQVEVGDESHWIGTHLFGEPPRIIPYHDDDGVVNAAGNPVARGDQVLARYFPPGAIGFAIRHHRPRYRELVAGDTPSPAVKDEIRLRDTHLEVLVGVLRDSQPGVITLNSPQAYENGRFGGADYPMIFVEPVFPDFLTPAQVQAFRDNIRTYLLAFNAVLRFPVRYLGGDPLSARSPDDVRNNADMAVRAIAGDVEAQQFFARTENRLYCSEMAHLASSAGLLVPLNARTLVPLVGEDAWRRFVGQVEAHDQALPSTFTELNRNPFAQLVEAALAPEDLEPVPAYSPRKLEDSEQLAFRPMTMADLVEQFVRVFLPRERLGEKTAPAQAQLLRLVKPGVLEAMALDRLSAEDPRRSAVSALYDRIVAAVGMPDLDYQSFRTRLQPLLEEARWLVVDASGEGLYVPPSLLHLAAQGQWSGGLLRVRYVGHGMHYSLVLPE